MDNIKLPAYPVDAMEWDEANHKVRKEDPMAAWSGFTKLELASLMIAQGLAEEYMESKTGAQGLAKRSVMFAKAILEEANK